RRRDAGGSRRRPQLAGDSGQPGNMRNTFTIAGKELQGYFTQPVAYVVLTVFLLLGGWFFFAMLRQFDEMVQLVQMMGQPDQLKLVNLNNRVIDPLLHDLSI